MLSPTLTWQFLCLTFEEKKGGKGERKKRERKKVKLVAVVDLDVSCDVVLVERGLAHILSTLAKN